MNKALHNEIQYPDFFEIMVYCYLVSMTVDPEKDFYSQIEDAFRIFKEYRNPFDRAANFKILHQMDPGEDNPIADRMAIEKNKEIPDLIHLIGLISDLKMKIHEFMRIHYELRAIIHNSVFHQIISADFDTLDHQKYFDSIHFRRDLEVQIRQVEDFSKKLNQFEIDIAKWKKQEK